MMRWMHLLILLGWSCVAPGLFCVADESALNPKLILVMGAEGTAEYGAQFRKSVSEWSDLAQAAKFLKIEIGTSPRETSDKKQLQSELAQLQPDRPVCLVMIGHGTSLRGTNKFNLRRTDVSSKELKEWLNDVAAPMVIVNCFSSSGPFVRELAAANRIVITATKSGAEQNYSRFGKFLSQAIQDISADLDHDRQISLLEAFLTASKNVERFYQTENRLATEQALLDDNGDGLGTPAVFFKGIHAVKSAKQGHETDGLRAHQFILLRNEEESQLTEDQRKHRDRLESEIERLRKKKSLMSEDAYYLELEKQMVAIARLYSD